MKNGLILILLLLALGSSSCSNRDIKALCKNTEKSPLSYFWDGNGEFVVDAANHYMGMAFGMHFISTVWDNGTLYTYYIVNKPDGKFAVGLATSIDGITFADQGIVVDVGAAGQWDDERASFPGVCKEGNTWYMVYEGSPGGFDPAAIGLATSQDGINWTKDPGNPILEHSGAGFMSHEIGTPSLWKEGSTWYLFYHGFDLDDCQIGVATGENLLNLTHHSTTVPVIPTSDSDWDCGTTGKRSSFIVKEGNYYYMAYEGSTDQPYNTARWSTGLARSTNLLTWTKCSRNPVISQTVSGMSFDGPDIVRTPDNTLHIYYRSPNPKNLNTTSRATLMIP